MKKGLAIIILTVISTANLTANDILTLFSKWENASKIDRIHIGNELLEKGTEEGLLMGKYRVRGKTLCITHRFSAV